MRAALSSNAAQIAASVDLLVGIQAVKNRENTGEDVAPIKQVFPYQKIQ